MRAMKKKEDGARDPFKTRNRIIVVIWLLVTGLFLALLLLSLVGLVELVLETLSAPGQP